MPRFFLFTVSQQLSRQMAAHVLASFNGFSYNWRQIGIPDCDDGR
jgi:hypothetical protein